MALFASVPFVRFQQFVRGLAMLASTWIAVPATSAFASEHPSEHPSERHGLDLNWIRLDGAERCLTAAELASRIEASVGRVLFVRAAEAELSIDGYVRGEDTPRGFRVTFQFSLPSREIVGRREIFLKGSDCSVIDASVGLLTKVMLDPHGTFDAGDALDPKLQKVLDELFATEPLDPKLEPSAAPEPVTRSGVRPEPASPASATTGTPTIEPPATRDVATFDAVAIADLGQRPGLGFGVGLRATIGSSPGWLVELGFSIYSQRTAAAASGQIGLELELGSLAICPVQLLGALALCAGGEYGRMTVSPKNFPRNESPSSQPIVDLSAISVLQLQLVGPLSLRAAATLAVPLLSNTYVYETPTGDRQLFRTSPVAARAELGIGFHL